MNHLAVCLTIRGERVGIVFSGHSAAKLVQQAETLENRIGFVGGDSFAVALKRAMMMERDEPGAWGPLDDNGFSLMPKGDALIVERNLRDLRARNQHAAFLAAKGGRR